MSVNLETKVVNIFNINPNWETNKFYVYIGRAGKGQDGYFGNPFIVGKDGTREEVFAKYVDWLAEKTQTDPIFTERLLALKGKILVCFCSPRLCHGDAIKAWLDFE